MNPCSPSIKNKHLSSVVFTEKKDLHELKEDTDNLSDLNKFMEDGTEDLSDFTLFLAPGGYADIKKMQLEQALNKGVPATDEELMLLAQEFANE